MKISKTKHITKKGIVKKNPIGVKISKKNYDYMYAVLPPLTWDLRETIDFLSIRDKNPDLVQKIRMSKAVGGFMQGEGWDKHDVYIETKDKKYYKIGKTKNVWNTELFRYGDWKTQSNTLRNIR